MAPETLRHRINSTLIRTLFKRGLDARGRSTATSHYESLNPLSGKMIKTPLVFRELGFLSMFSLDGTSFDLVKFVQKRGAN